MFRNRAISLLGRRSRSIRPSAIPIPRISVGLSSSRVFSLMGLRSRSILPSTIPIPRISVGLLQPSSPISTSLSAATQKEIPSYAGRSQSFHTKFQMVDGKRVPPVYKDNKGQGGKILRRVIEIPGAIEKQVPLNDYYYHNGSLDPCFWQVDNEEELQKHRVILVNWEEGPPGVLKVETDASLRSYRNRTVAVQGIVMRIRTKGTVSCLHSYFGVVSPVGRCILFYECVALCSGIKLVKDFGYHSLVNGVSLSSDSSDAVILVSANLECSSELDVKKDWVLAKVESDVDKEAVNAIVEEIVQVFIHISASEDFPWNSHTRIFHEYREALLLADLCTRSFTNAPGLRLVKRCSSFDYIFNRDLKRREPYLRLPKEMRANLLSQSNDKLLDVEATENQGDG